MNADIALQARENIKAVADIYSKEMLAELSKREKTIRTALTSIEKNMEKAAFNLYWIYSNKAYKSMGFESITDYALDVFDIGKSTAYGFINLVERFAAHSIDGSIGDRFDDRYKGYSSSKLSLLASLTDEQIEESGINPGMSVRDIKFAVKRKLSDDASDRILERFKKEDTEAEPGSPGPDTQGTMTVKDNELSVPSMPEPESETVDNRISSVLKDDDLCDLNGYERGGVYDFSIHDDERSILKKIKTILKENREKYEDAFFNLVLYHPVRKGEN